MRRISRKRFWAKVATNPDKEKVKQVFALLNEENIPTETFAEIKKFILECAAPAFQWAAELNDCKHTDSLVAQITQAIELVEKESGGSMEWLEKCDQTMIETQIARIGRSFALQHRCHSNEKSVVCYCDEEKS